MLYYNSRFSHYFRDASFVLQSHAGTSYRTTLWVTYDIERGVKLEVYNDLARKVIHVGIPDTAEALDDFVEDLEAEFDIDVSKSLVGTAHEFISLLPEAFTISVDLGAGWPMICKNCKTEGQTWFKGAFFPGFGTNVDAIAVRFGHVCGAYRGQYASSLDSDSMDAVWNIIDDACRNAADEDSKHEVEVFKSRLLGAIQPSYLVGNKGSVI